MTTNEQRSLKDDYNWLKDHIAIEQLLARYVHAIDQGYGEKRIEPDEFDFVFDESAVYLIPERRVMVKGLNEIKNVFISETKEVVFAMHVILNPLIESRRRQRSLQSDHVD